MLKILRRSVKFGRIGVRTLCLLDQPNCPKEGFMDIRVPQGGNMINLRSFKYPSKTSEVRAVNLLFHGYDEHLNRLLKPYANYLAEQGICSIGIDQRGFGNSQGIRAYLRSYDDIVSDTMIFFNKVMEKDDQLRGKPVFFMGISMGGVSAFYTALKHPKLAKGIIAFSPGFSTTKEVAASSSFIIKLAPLLRPFSKIGYVKFSHLLSTKDPELLAHIEKDFLGYKKKMLLGTGLEILRGGKYVVKNAKQLVTPYLLYQGENDRIVDPAVAIKFNDRTVNVEDKKLVMIPKGEHIALVDKTEFEKIKVEVLEWINKRI